MKESEKISYIEMPSRDLAATKHFFNRVFGWTFVDYGSEYAGIENAGIDGGFYKSEMNARTENGSVLVILYSSKLESALERVKTEGGEIVKDIFSFPGGRRFHFSDPNGNEYAVWSEEKS